MNILSDSQRLKNFIIENFGIIEIQSKEVTNRLEFPDFELLPFDYLEYAEKELADIKENNAKKINCISHIKRAIEC